MAGFEQNKKDAFDAYAPFFSGLDLFTLPNSFTFASNMVFTPNEFINAPHVDDNFTGLALGFFFMAHRETGLLYFPDPAKSPVDIRGAFMAFPKYGFAVKLAQQNVGLEMTWAVNEVHHSLRQKLSMPKVDVSLPRKQEFVFLVLPFKLTNVYLPEFSNCINQCLTRSGMFYVPSIREVLKITLTKKKK